jgi:hypothetical protein
VSLDASLCRLGRGGNMRSGRLCRMVRETEGNLTSRYISEYPKYKFLIRQLSIFFVPGAVVFGFLTSCRLVSS